MVQMRVYDSKCTIWNEGNLPEGMDIESLKQHHISRPRNPIITDICFKAGYIDSWGRGTLKIIEECKNANLPEPEITTLDGGIFVTLYKKQEIVIKTELVDSKRSILKLIALNPTISKREMAEQIGINTTAIDKNLVKLKEENKIKRVGNNKTGFWEIVK